MIDEFERTKARNAIIEYLRSAGRGGVVVKGGVNQRPIHFYIRHMVAVFSIEVGLARAAERSRFIVVNLKKDPSRKPRLPNSIEAEQLRIDLMAFALWAAYPAKKMIQELGQIPGFEDRMAECFAVPLAMLTVVDDNPLKELRKLVRVALESLPGKDQDILEDDESKLLQDIGAATIRTVIRKENESGNLGHDVSTDASVSQLLEAFSAYNDHVLQAHGLKYEGGHIFLAPSVIERKLLRDTTWKGMNIFSILKRVKGAEKSRTNIGGQKIRGILLRDRRRLVEE
jgi:hypothetical protein